MENQRRSLGERIRQGMWLPQVAPHAVDFKHGKEHALRRAEAELFEFLGQGR